jgi:purine-binding chemotaxis protein CheW
MPLEWTLFEEDGPSFRGGSPEGEAPLFVTFDLVGQTLAVAVATVREITDRTELTRVPGSPPDLSGLLDLRGSSIPIVDLDRRLGLPGRSRDEASRMIVFDLDGPGGRTYVGALADRVRNVIAIPEAQVEPIRTEIFRDWDARTLLGIHRREGESIVLLDPHELLAPQKVLAA